MSTDIVLCSRCNLPKPIEFEYWDSKAFRNKQLVKKSECKDCFNKKGLEGCSVYV